MKTAINLNEKFSKFSEHWSPKIIAQMNDYHFKLVKFQGEFVWHDHKDTDEVFIVLDLAEKTPSPRASIQEQRILGGFWPEQK